MMSEKISEFEGHISGYEGGSGWLNIHVATINVRNEGAIDVIYSFPFLRRPGEVRLDEYRGKRVKVTVEVIEDEEKRGMTEQEQKRLEHAKRQYLLRINDTPIAILVDDNDKDIVAGCFEASSNGNPEWSDKEMVVPISLKPIQDEAVLGYAHFMLAGIIEQIKLEKKDGVR